MKYKKFAAGLILTSILSMNFVHVPCFAAGKKNKLIKTQVTEYRFDYVNTDWWKTFDDEYLTEYIIKAIENNYDLKIATLKVEQYHQMTKLQFANELPQISGGFSPTGIKLPGSTSTSGIWAFPLNVSYELDLFLKNRDKTRSVKKEWEKSKFDERASYIAISSAVGATYFNIIKADKLIELQKEIIKDRKQIYELMSERNKIGLTSTADLVKANKAFVSATADLADLEKTRTTLLNSLAVLIGESPANINDLKRKEYEESYLVKVPESIPSEIIDQRPDYLAAEKMVEKAGIDVRVAKKEFLPNINLFGLMAFGSSALGNAFTWGNVFGVLSASAMLNLFTGGRKIANLRLKKNAYEQILQNYYKTNITAIQEVNDALVALKQDDKKYKTNLNVYKMEQKDFKYSQAKYEEGLISYLDLIQRKENLLVLNKQVVQNQLDCNVDYIGLYKATGAKI
ncbi:MAG: TolC family protein [Clostridium sp.]|nr:TolC family protein [Clostridium sp.]